MGIVHQVVIDAYPREVYEVLADAAALSALSGRSGTAGRGDGEEFTAFDGHVTGRQIELVPGIRIVQAWRFPAWEPGTYTLVRFTLTAEPAEPAGADALGCHPTWRAHLNEGWPMFYLTPLVRHFEAQAASARAAAADEIAAMTAAVRPSPASAR